MGISPFFKNLMTNRVKKGGFYWLLAALFVSVLSACTDPSDANDVEELSRKGDNVFTVGGVAMPVDVCVDGYDFSDGGVTHILHLFTNGFYTPNGDGTCSPNNAFKKAGAYVEIPAFDKGQTELLRLMTGDYMTYYSNSDDWAGNYEITKENTTRALVYDKMVDLQVSTIQVKKKDNIYEITWDGRDEKGNVCSLYYYGVIQSEKMLGED